LPNSIYNSCEYALNIKLNRLDEDHVETELRFFINLIDHLAGTFYEAIHSVFHDKNTPVFCNGKEVGEIISLAIDDEELLPYFYRANDPTYRIFLEYNAFYKKFLFFKIRFYEDATYDCDDLVIPLNLKKENLEINFVNKINKISKTINDSIIDWSQIVYWPKNSFQDLHFDSASNKTTLSSICYLNDNYEGGQTYFEDGTIFTPITGRILFFDGKHYLHGVKKIISGNRYVLAIWYKNDKN
jgi:hypothetical protein